jgi:tetratricopeptide (TPR) repeat protein
MQRLGRYRLTQELGAGGAGRVFKAELRGPGGYRREVAVKVLHRDTGALQREARIGGLLRHQHLVDVYEIGEDDGRWFAAMEYCEGGCLTDHLPLPPRAVVEVGLQVCEALQYAHEELGLIHRDIKPDNLLIKEGQIKVADLGIARARGFAARDTVSGTPAFMAPEQLRGGPLDARADIYALGVTLVVLATCALPDRSPDGSVISLSPSAPTPDTGSETFLNWDDETLRSPAAAAGALETLDHWGDPSGDTALLTTEEVPTPPPAPLELAGVPGWLAPVAERCLALSPDGRFDDMAALALALRALEVGGRDLRGALGWRPAAPPPRDPGGNLGEEPDAFIGRRDELAALLEALDAGGQLTLLGPAGVGKSRLATAAARRWRAQRGGPAWFCDLSQARSAEGLLAAVASALDVPLSGADTEALVDTLGHAIAGRGEATLVLDNFEQLTDLAGVVSRWRALAPEARLVVTSRQPLGLPGERLLTVPPLDAGHARALLVARARERGAELAEDPDLEALAEALEGLPLALELAAGRLGVLSVRDVLDRLGLGLLRRGTSGRHGTLEAALDWSWALLSPAEQRGLAQLSVFRGGFTLEAAEAVLDLGDPDVAAAPGAPWALDVLTSLVEKSLVRPPEHPRPDLPPRFSLFQTLQEYAGRELADGGRAERRHGAWVAGLCAHRALEGLHTHGGDVRWWALSAERDNLIAACERALSRGDLAVATAAARGADAVLSYQGPYSTARDLLQRALALHEAAPSPTSGEAWLALELGEMERMLAQNQRAGEHLRFAAERFRRLGERSGEVRALCRLGRLENSLGAPEAARSLYQRALALAVEAGDEHGEATAHTCLGALESHHGRYREAADHAREALRRFQRVGDRRAAASAVSNLGMNRCAFGQLEEGLVDLRRGLAEHRAVGNLGNEAVVLSALGRQHAQRGQHEEALAAFQQALTLSQRLGDRHLLVSQLNALAIVSRARGQLDRAQEYYSRALALAQATGQRALEALVTGNLANLLHQLGDDEQSLERYRQALRAHRELGQRHEEGRVLGNLGLLLARLGRSEEALAQYREALDLLLELGDRSEEGVVRRNLGCLLLQGGERAQGEAELDLAAAIAEQLKEPLQLLWVHLERGLFLAGSGEREQALAPLREAEALAAALDLAAESEQGAALARLRRAVRGDREGQ